jgi:hypothetical protein
MTPSEIREKLAALGHCDHAWLNKYMAFIDGARTPWRYHEQHHILPKSIWPEFESLDEHRWNCKSLSAADHLKAHYILFRALPKQWHFYRAFLGMTTDALAGSDLGMRELAAGFQKEASDSGLMRYWERKQISADDLPF